MNPKVIIPIIVVVVLLLATPMLMNVLRGPSDEPAPKPVQAPPSPPPVAPPPSALPPEILHMPVVHDAPQPRTSFQNQAAPSAQNPLTPQTLPGTAWEVNTPQGAVVIELGPNGQATASHPLVGAIPGNWSVQGNRVTASASFMGQSMSINATIEGSTLKVQGQNVRRLR